MKKQQLFYPIILHENLFHIFGNSTRYELVVKFYLIHTWNRVAYALFQSLAFDRASKRRLDKIKSTLTVNNHRIYNL